MPESYWPDRTALPCPSCGRPGRPPLQGAIFEIVSCSPCGIFLHRRQWNTVTIVSAVASELATAILVALGLRDHPRVTALLDYSRESSDDMVDAMAYALHSIRFPSYEGATLQTFYQRNHDSIDMWRRRNWRPPRHPPKSPSTPGKCRNGV